MQQRATTTLLTLSLLLLFGASTAFGQFATDWERNAANSSKPSWFEDPTARGIAYGVTDDGTGATHERVFVSQANNVITTSGDIEIHILDANDGSDVGTLPLGSADGGPGTLSISDIDVTDDGVIYACNQSDNEFNPFTCYRWEDEQATPTQITLYTNNERNPIGFYIGLKGVASDNSLTIMTAAENAADAYRFTTTDNGATFVPTRIPLKKRDGTPITNAAKIGSAPDASPKGTGVTGFYVSGGGYYPIEFDATGTQQGLANSGVSFATNSVEYFEKKGQDFIAIVERQNSSTDTNHGTILNVTGGGDAATSYGDTPSQGTADGANYFQDIDIRDNSTITAKKDDTVTAYVLEADNGLGAYTTDMAPFLPVELASFTATADGADVLLSWRTASETHNARFDVQRETDAGWSKIGSREGAGTTARPQSYRFRARGLAPGTHRFRLKQVDGDGAKTFSEPVAATVQVRGTHALSSPAPNPFRTSTTLTLNVTERQDVTAAAYDLLGRRVATLHDGPVEGRVTLRLQASDLPSGVYVVRVRGERFAETRKVTLVR